MYLEAVTVCVGFADYLIHSIEQNQPLFDRWIIVTTEDDNATRSLCHRHGLECQLTNEFYRGGEKFSKGRGIARGVEMLSHRDWLLHLDADILLPRKTRQLLESSHLDPTCIYGCDRANIIGWDNWLKFKKTDYLNHEWHCLLHFPPGYDVGSRFVTVRDGYVPIGAFQLWHQSRVLERGHQTRPIPFYNGDACHDDIRLALQWDRRKRLLLPEIIAIHIQSELAGWGADWGGRKRKPFGPPQKSGGGVCY